MNRIIRTPHLYYSNRRGEVYARDEVGDVLRPAIGTPERMPRGFSDEIVQEWTAIKDRIFLEKLIDML